MYREIGHLISLKRKSLIHSLNIFDALLILKKFGFAYIIFIQNQEDFLSSRQRGLVTL